MWARPEERELLKSRTLQKEEANTLVQFSESKDLRGGLVSIVRVSFLFLCIEPKNTRIERKRLKASAPMSKYSSLVQRVSYEQIL